MYDEVMTLKWHHYNYKTAMCVTRSYSHHTHNIFVSFSYHISRHNIKETRHSHVQLITVWTKLPWLISAEVVLAKSWPSVGFDFRLSPGLVSLTASADGEHFIFRNSCCCRRRSSSVSSPHGRFTNDAITTDWKHNGYRTFHVTKSLTQAEGV